MRRTELLEGESVFGLCNDYILQAELYIPKVMDRNLARHSML